MWSCITILYLIPAAILTHQLLTVRRSPDEATVAPEFAPPQNAASQER